MKPENTSNVIAGIALAVSALALIVSGLMLWRQNRLQERVTAIEEARWRKEVEAHKHARVTASVPDPGMAHGHLVLTNEGAAVARSMTAEVSSTDESKRPPDVFGLEELPVDLHPGQTMSFSMGAAWEDAPLINVLVRWEDDAGRQEVTYTLRTL